MMTFHSNIELAIKVHDAVNTDLDLRSNLLIMDKFGQILK